MTERKKKHEYRSPFDFDVSKMTVEEAEQKLREKGFPVGEWTDNYDATLGEDGQPKEEPEQAQIPTFKFYAEMLEHIRDICEDQVKHDLREIDNLNYQLRRLKRGGGR